MIARAACGGRRLVNGFSWCVSGDCRSPIRISDFALPAVLPANEAATAYDGSLFGSRFVNPPFPGSSLTRDTNLGMTGDEGNSRVDDEEGVLVIHGVSSDIIEAERWRLVSL